MATAHHTWVTGTSGVANTGRMHTAHTSNAVLRAALVVQPRRNKADDSQPPAIPPRLATAKITTSGRLLCVRPSPKRLFRKSGTQKM
jgi:hypothetical protein